MNTRLRYDIGASTAIAGFPLKRVGCGPSSANGGRLDAVDCLGLHPPPHGGGEGWVGTPSALRP